MTSLSTYGVFSSSVAGWPPFGKWLLARLTMCSLCVLSICNISCFPFSFRGLYSSSDCSSF